MKQIALGKTGLQVAELGLGGIPIQKSDVKSVRELLLTMYKEGMNYIDTARSYTISENFLGEALDGIREKFVLATKSMARTKEGMQKDIETSLINLKTKYIDLYQIHNPSVEELKQVCAVGGALEALMEAKEKGKIGHLGLTAHSLSVFEAGLDLPWVETIMFPYNIVETQGEKLIEECRKRKIGFIVMKPLAGGAIEDGRLALRFIKNNPNISIVIPGMYSVEELLENKKSWEEKEALSQQEQEQIEQIRKQLGNHFCRRCNYCQPCTAGINISGCFLLSGYLERYGLVDWAKKRYEGFSVKASACISCGVCETRCPYQLPIRDMLKKCVVSFGE